MDQLLELTLILVAAWRIVVGTIVGLLLAFVASLLLPVPAGAWFFVGFLGAAGGTAWQVAVASPETPTRPTEQPNLSLASKVLAFFAVATLGGLWGHLVASALGPTTAVVCVLVTPLILGPIFAAISKEKVTLFAVALASLASLIGFYTPQAIEWFFQAREA